MPPREAIDEFLQRIATAFNGHARTFRYRDGSVDGQVTMRLSEGDDSMEVFAEVEEFIVVNRLRALLPATAFINTGVIYRPSRGYVLGQRIARGTAQANTSYFPKKQFLHSVLATREFLVKNIRKLGLNEPHEIFLRVNWNPQGERPRRVRGRTWLKR